MTRKMHDTLMAVLASSSLLVVGLIAAAPVVPVQDVNAGSDGFAAMIAETAVLPSAAELPDALPVRQSRSARHSRNTMAMPFFSFAPRG